MTRSLAVRMFALVAVVAVSFWYIAFEVAGWRLGAQDFHVQVMMARAGGIYTEADVTYRGVSVGRVDSLHPGPDGVTVSIELHPGTKIPLDSTAQVRELSAAGEQYLDLVPKTASPPYLTAGSVIPETSTATPVPISQVLYDTSSLLNSLNGKDISTVTNELAKGFGGTGSDLRNIVVAAQNLVSALQQAEPLTVTLIDSGNTVLRTLDATNRSFGTFASSLDSLSGQLRASNSDIVALLANGIGTEKQVSKLLDQYSGTFVSALRNVGAVGKVTLAQLPAMQALFEALPVFAGRIGAVVHGGTLHVELTYNTSSPVCPYVSGSQTALPTQKTGAPDLNRDCASSGLLVRGADNAP